MIVDCVSDLVPMKAAVFVVGTPMRVFSPDGFPVDHLRELQSRFETFPNPLRDLAAGGEQHPEPRWLSDGSFAFMLPLVHSEVIKGVLCLHRANLDCQDALLNQVKSLEPVCQIAGAAIARTLELEAESRRIPQTQPSGEKPMGGFDARTALMSKLLDNVAHDIRTPTTAVRGYLRMLVDGRVGPMTPEQKECLEIALRSAEQLAALATSIAEASSVLEGLNAEALDLRDLWSLACNANRPRILAGGFLIKERIPPGRVPVNGDRAVLTAAVEGTLAYALDGVETGREVQADLSGGGTMDATLRIELPRSGCKDDAARNASLSKLRNKLFLHGGTLTLGYKGEQAVFTISLPGYSR